jgi:transcriptional regulator with XRE-family HTH domain
MSETQAVPATERDDTLDATMNAHSPLEPRDATPEELGHRIKMLRVMRGLTLKDLEQRGGISATHVSEIERGKASPTIGALSRIAHALDIRPAILIGTRSLPEVTLRRANERDAHTAHWGQVTITALHAPTQDGDMSLHQFTLPIGRESALTHHHAGEEWITVLTGVAEIRIDDKSHMLREGDSLHFRAHRPHSYVNLASVPAVLLVAGHPRLGL